jgi:inner membrane transporter RhtA
MEMSVVTTKNPTVTGDGAGPAPGRWRGILPVLTVLTGATSNQLGAGVGAQTFDAIGPVGVVAVRQAVAAVVLLPVARPPLRRLTRAQWWPALLLALVFATMNLAVYTAIDRIGLALAITLEFLGPLAVALAGSRTRAHLVTAGIAAVGVYVLVLPGPASDRLGLLCGLGGGACWAAYIGLNRVVGARLPGLQGPALASGVSALAYLPVLVVLTADGRWDRTTVARVLLTGVLSSVVPYAADTTALRTVPPRVYGVLSSAQPALAGLVGLVLLGQHLAPHEWAGIGTVIAANVLVVSTGREAAVTAVGPPSVGAQDGPGLPDCPGLPGCLGRPEPSLVE